MFEQTGQGRSLKNTRLTWWKAAKDKTNYPCTPIWRNEKKDTSTTSTDVPIYKPKKDYSLTIYHLR